MELLLTNDDGIDAAGLHALERAMARLGTVYTVAPQIEQSSKGHGFSLHAPVRVEPKGERRWAVTGTPADCAYVALHGILPVRPHAVISGVNHGSNLGGDVFYSGTVAAAMEATFQGFPALAVSLHRTGDTPYTNFDAAAELAATLIERLISEDLPGRTCLNLNVPDLPATEIRGIRIAAQGWRHYEASVDVRTDPRGKAYYWLGGAHSSFEDLPDTDGPLVERGWATLTPLHADLTRYDLLPGLRRWLE